VGSASGGWDGGTNVGRNDCAVVSDGGTPPPTGCGDNTSFSDLGRACTGNTDCEARLCYGKVGYSTICTKRCATAANCPEGWKCELASDGLRVCMIGSTSTGTVSSNTDCAQISFSDIGLSCSQASQCQSLMCTKGGYCTRRCESSADCGSLSCTSINGGLLKACSL